MIFGGILEGKGAFFFRSYKKMVRRGECPALRRVRGVRPGPDPSGGPLAGRSAVVVIVHICVMHDDVMHLMGAMQYT